jgi:hypothetical protein
VNRLLSDTASRHVRAAGTPSAARRDGSIDSGHAHVLLANLGFLFVPGPPLDHGAAYLLVAFRKRPTLEHFDPEVIEYWARDANNGIARPAELRWASPPFEARFAWGTIKVIDRIGASNTFVTFGGDVAVSRDQDVHAALFNSEAPILSLGGHSGPADPLGAIVAGFLASLRGAAGYDSPVRALADDLSPTCLYAAFVCAALDNYQHPSAADYVSAHLVSVLRSERHRLDQSHAQMLREGQQLADLIYSWKEHSDGRDG